jgi:putative membrane protein
MANEQDKNGNGNDSQNRWGRLPSILGIVLGLGILAGSILLTDFSEIIEAIGKGGPKLFLLGLFYSVELASRGYAWKVIYYTQSKEIATRFFLIGMWFAQSVNRLLPTATIGGMFVRGRYLREKGGDETVIFSSLIVDKTTHGVSAVVVLFLGLILVLIEHVGEKIIIIILSISLTLSVAIYIFIQIQRSPKVEKLLNKWSGNEEGFFGTLKSRAREVEKELDNIYAHPSEFILAVLIRVAGDLALTAEVWVAARLMHTPISVLDALTLRLVGFGIRSAAFVIWGGMGVQEAIYGLLSGFIGVSPASLIAISLVTRLREFIPAVPGVALWLGLESYHQATDQSESKKKVNTIKTNE